MTKISGSFRWGLSKRDHFKDVDHLNVKGATKLSRMIRDEVGRLRAEAS